MFVRKSSIAQLIKREKDKERKRCLKEGAEVMNQRLKNLEMDYTKMIRDLKTEHKKELIQRDKEIKRLNREIDKHYETYNDIRRREKHLDLLSSEIEDVVDSMVVKVQESLQPFFRARSKVESTKRKGDRAHDKVESIFRAVK